MELYIRDSAPSEARKRGSGGGSPRKTDDPPAGPSDLSTHAHVECTARSGQGLSLTDIVSQDLLDDYEKFGVVFRVGSVESALIYLNGQ
jgi:hypothetical protein